MSTKRSSYRPCLETLEDRCQPSTTLGHGFNVTTAAAATHPNTLPAFIYNPFVRSNGDISTTTGQHTQSSNPGYIFNPFSSSSGITASQGSHAIIFNPFH